MNNDLKQRVLDKVNECASQIEKLYGIKMPEIKIRFDINSARVAGLARLRLNEVRFNPHFLEKYAEAFIARTVPHEVAHLGVHQVWSQKSHFGNRHPAPHGLEWKTMMRRLGADPSRCHDYVADVNIGRKKASFHYTCTVCSKNYTVGPKIHNNMQLGIRKYRCQCGGPIEFVNTLKPAVPSVAQTRSTQPKAPAAGSKLGRCYEWFKSYVNADKELVIAVFRNEVGMTRAGATTYYYQCRKMYEAGV